MPKGHSELPGQVIKLQEQAMASNEVIAQCMDRIAALERRIAQMDDAFSRGNLPAPRGHQTLAVQ